MAVIAEKGLIRENPIACDGSTPACLDPILWVMKDN